MPCADEPRSRASDATILAGFVKHTCLLRTSDLTCAAAGAEAQLHTKAVRPLKKEVSIMSIFQVNAKAQRYWLSVDTSILKQEMHNT